jgi:hypothetical protein
MNLSNIYNDVTAHSLRKAQSIESCFVFMLDDIIMANEMGYRSWTMFDFDGITRSFKEEIAAELIERGFLLKMVDKDLVISW